MKPAATWLQIQGYASWYQARMAAFLDRKRPQWVGSASSRHSNAAVHRHHPQNAELPERMPAGTWLAFAPRGRQRQVPGWTGRSSRRSPRSAFGSRRHSAGQCRRAAASLLLTFGQGVWPTASGRIRALGCSPCEPDTPGGRTAATRQRCALSGTAVSQAAATSGLLPASSSLRAAM